VRRFAGQEFADPDYPDAYRQPAAASAAPATVPDAVSSALLGAAEGGTTAGG
jgi:hypothetical protein